MGEEGRWVFFWVWYGMVLAVGLHIHMLYRRPGWGGKRVQITRCIPHTQASNHTSSKQVYIST